MVQLLCIPGCKKRCAWQPPLFCADVYFVCSVRTSVLFMLNADLAKHHTSATNAFHSNSKIAHRSARSRRLRFCLQCTMGRNKKSVLQEAAPAEPVVRDVDVVHAALEKCGIVSSVLGAKPIIQKYIKESDYEPEKIIARIFSLPPTSPLRGPALSGFGAREKCAVSLAAALCCRLHENKKPTQKTHTKKTQQKTHGTAHPTSDSVNQTLKKTLVPAPSQTASSSSSSFSAKFQPAASSSSPSSNFLPEQPEKQLQHLEDFLSGSPPADKFAVLVFQRAFAVSFSFSMRGAPLKMFIVD